LPTHSDGGDQEAALGAGDNPAKDSNYRSPGFQRPSLRPAAMRWWDTCSSLSWPRRLPGWSSTNCPAAAHHRRLL